MAVLLAAVAAGLFVAAVALAIVDVVGGHGAETGEFIIAGFAPGFIVAGLIVARHRPELPVGWLYLTGGVTSASAGLSAAYAGSALAHGWPGATWALWVTSWTWFCHDTCAAVAILVFPEGRPLSRRRRWLVAVPLVAITVAVVLTMLQPGGITITPGTAAVVRRMANPLGLTTLPGLRLLRNIALIVAAVVTILGALVLIVVRFFRSKGALRAQLRWLAVVVVVSALAPPTVAIANIAATVLGQVVVTSAIVRRGALGIDVALRRSVLAAALLATALGSYLAGVAVVGAAVGRSGPVVSAVAATAAVFAFAPLSVQVRRRVDQLFYGRRSQPYAVVAALGQRLGDAPNPEDGLEALVGTLSEELRVPFVEVTAGSGEVLARRGTPEGGDEPVAFELTHQGHPVGRLRVGRRRGEAGIGAAERSLLTDLARQVGAAVHAVAVLADLRRARGRLVVAREDERRRLQRDLHDGLGPRLTAVAYTIDAARNRLPAETGTAIELLRQSSGNALAAVAEVRRLVYALGDPILDSLGLVGAVRDQASRFPHGEGDLDIEVCGEDIGGLPAAVEVAAYRIASEAMTNAIRHAQARRCRVTISNCDAVLRVSVGDDGIGLPPGWKPGVGIRSMGDRAAEVGGAVEISNGPDGGVRVEASLPARIAELP